MASQPWNFHRTTAAVFYQLVRAAPALVQEKGIRPCFSNWSVLRFSRVQRTGGLGEKTVCHSIYFHQEPWPSSHRQTQPSQSRDWSRGRHAMGMGPVGFCPGWEREWLRQWDFVSLDLLEPSWPVGWRAGLGKEEKGKRRWSLFLAVPRLLQSAAPAFAILSYLRHSCVVKSNALFTELVCMDFSSLGRLPGRGRRIDSFLFCTRLTLDLFSMVPALWFYAAYQGWPHLPHPYSLAGIKGSSKCLMERGQGK